jgi:prophage regulatory protein
MTDRMLNIKEVAERVGVCPDTIRNRVNDGSFPPPKRPSKRRIGWLESDVQAWMNAL